MVITSKHVAAVLMWILILLLQTVCIGWCKNFDNIKMHATALKIIIIDLKNVGLIRRIDGQVSYCWRGYCPGQSKSRARCVVVFCLFACLQVLLTNTKTLDKAFVYKFLYPWLGEGLLTSTGTLVWIQFPVIYLPGWYLTIEIIVPSGLLQTTYMVFHIVTLNFKINVHYNTYRYFQSHTTHS